MMDFQVYRSVIIIVRMVGVFIFVNSGVDAGLPGTLLTDTTNASCPITPLLTAVVKNSDGSSKAVFGYTNPGSSMATRPVAADNNFLFPGNSGTASLPVNFFSGTFPEAFTVDFQDDSLVWTLDGVYVTAYTSAAVDREFGMWHGRTIGRGIRGAYHITNRAISLTVDSDNATAVRNPWYYVAYTTGSDVSLSARYPLKVSGCLTRAGLAIRSDTSENDAFCALFTNKQGDIIRECRPARGAEITSQSVGTVEATPWCRIEKKGTLVKIYLSVDGLTWQSAGTDYLSTRGSAMIGFASVAAKQRGTGTIAFENVDIAFTDNNSNAVPDVVEAEIGSSARGLPRRSDWINTGMAVSVTDDYSAISGYDHCTGITTRYGAGCAEGVALPVIRLIETSSAPVPVYAGCKGCTVDGGMLHNVTGAIPRYTSIMQAFPLSLLLRGVPGVLLRLDWFNPSAGEWVSIPFDFVTSSALYAHVGACGYYRIAADRVIKKAATSQELTDALEEARQEATAESPYAIICKGSPGETVYSGGLEEAAFTVPANVVLIGSVPDVDSIDPQTPFAPDPSRFPSILTVRESAADLQEGQAVLDIRGEAENGTVKKMGTTVQGFVIRGGGSPAARSGVGGMRIMGTGGIISDVNVTCCTFEKNCGTAAGALLMVNTHGIRIDRSIFVENRQAPLTTLTGTAENGALYGGSAICVVTDRDSSAEDTISNCVFLGNKAFGETGAGTVTLYTNLTKNNPAAVYPWQSGAPRLVIAHCTFTRNRAASLSGTCAGAIVNSDSGTGILVVVNSIIWNNTPEGANCRSIRGLGNTDITFSAINGTFAPADEYGTISSDPGFIDPATAQGLRLCPASACRNRGKDFFPAAVDLAGHLRTTGRYDMGAFEQILKVQLFEDSLVAGEKYTGFRMLLKHLFELCGYDITYATPYPEDPTPGNEIGTGREMISGSDTATDIDLVVRLVGDRYVPQTDTATATTEKSAVTEWKHFDTSTNTTICTKMITLKIPIEQSVEASSTDDKKVTAEKVNTIFSAICSVDSPLAREWRETIVKAFE